MFSGCRPISGTPKEGTAVKFVDHHNENDTEDLPNPRFLRLHAAVAGVIHMSGTTEYVENYLRDLRDTCVFASDGTTSTMQLFMVHSLAKSLPIIFSLASGTLETKIGKYKTSCGDIWLFKSRFSQDDLKDYSRLDTQSQVFSNVSAGQIDFQSVTYSKGICTELRKHNGAARSIQARGLEMVEIQHVAPHVPGNEVPTFLDELILVPPPIANIPSASNKHHRSPTPLDGPSKWLKFDCVLIEGMDIDEQHVDQQHVDGLPDDKSAMDVDDPQDNSLQISASDVTKVIDVTEDLEEIDIAPMPAGPVHDERLSRAEELACSFAQADLIFEVERPNCRHPPTILQSTLATFDPIIVFGEVPKFTKKDPSSVSLEESHGPLLWQLHQPLAPLPPDAIKNLKSSAAGMCSHYIRHFLAKIKAAKGRTPSDECHYVSIQEWVLEYSNTLWEDDCSPLLLDTSLTHQTPFQKHNLLFSGPPDLQCGESMHRVLPFTGSVDRAWTATTPNWSYNDMLFV
ncbi:hypothetical protein BS47DRAFT_1387541 [Hydnum rufescens UP504]|uniref:Uncharacterized protein n=2 Tax=Hydnum rufescens UP504 TaxID=1448309 RepID=A0A9P6E1W4_9AGAM|nr:hypothetical protein BS47DRAFT_1387541 [Hydnum rufescens UP504]